MPDMNKTIYLDHNATTPCDPKVLESMLPYFKEHWGNAASRNHSLGWHAQEAVKLAREQIAALIGVEEQEIIFTSGATESDNLALKGVFDMYRRKGNHLITLKTEHSAVLDPCRRIEKLGGKVTYLDVDSNGLIDLSSLEDAITEETVLVSVMWANNETGVIQPMKEIGEICTRKGVLLMSDATQAVGKIPVHPKEAGIHLMAFTAHKMYGPKGVGALYVSRRNPRVKLTPLLDGGGHERGMRSGTLNVPGIAGFGTAAALALERMEKDTVRLAALRDQFEEKLFTHLSELYRNGHATQRMPHVSNLSFRFSDAEALIMTFNQEIAASTGAACSSASLEPSPVLLAMGRSEDLAQSAIRFSLGRKNTEEEIRYAADAVIKGVRRLRGQSPVWEMFQEGLLGN
jgi:cysteine desulfurase